MALASAAVLGLMNNAKNLSLV